MSDETTTTQTPPQLSGQPLLSPSTAPAQAEGSTPIQTTPEVAARPDYVPETYWDPTANAVKPEFTSYIGELAALKAEHDARVAARPEKPEGYEPKYPDGYQPAVAINIDTQDPEYKLAAEYAHQSGMPQAKFSELLAKRAELEVARAQAQTQAREAEMKKLGPNATARVTANKTWLESQVGDKGAERLLGLIETADDFAMLENWQRRLSSQGGGSFSGAGRDNTPPATPKPLAERMYPNLPSARTS